MKGTVPEALHSLMPDQPVPAFRFSAKNLSGGGGGDKGEGKAYVDVARGLMSQLKAHSAGDAVLKYLDTEVSAKLGAAEAAAHGHGHGRLRILFPILLEAGQKSYSHVMSLIERYKDLLKKLVAVDPAEAHSVIVSAVSEYWQHSQQVTALPLPLPLPRSPVLTRHLVLSGAVLCCAVLAVLCHSTSSFCWIN
jgi:hypothetical protein